MGERAARPFCYHGTSLGPRLSPVFSAVGVSPNPLSLSAVPLVVLVQRRLVVIGVDLGLRIGNSSMEGLVLGCQLLGLLLLVCVALCRNGVPRRASCLIVASSEMSASVRAAMLWIRV